MFKTHRILLIPTPDSGSATAEAPPERGGDYNDAFSAIDSIEGDVFPTDTRAAEASAPPEAPAKVEAPPAAKVEEAAPAKTSPKPVMDDLLGLAKREAELKSPQPAPAAKAKEEAPTSMKQFREQYELTKKERDDLAVKLKELDAAKADGTRKEVEAATSSLKKELDDIRKRNDELDTEVRFMDYTRSRDYKERFEEPVKNAWKAAIDDIDGIVVEDGDGERPASHRDIVALMGMPTGKAAVEAQKLFGPAAPEIMVHRRKLIELRDNRQKAIGEWKEKGLGRDQDRQTQQQQQVSLLHSAFDEEFTTTETEYSALFGKEEGDDEGNSLLESGMKLVRMGTKGEGLDESLSPIERGQMMARAQAQMGLRARAFGRERLRSIRLQQKVKELEKRLSDLSGSEPGSGRTAARESAAPKNPEDAIDMM
jgi:hypothetical protein